MARDVHNPHLKAPLTVDQHIHSVLSEDGRSTVMEMAAAACEAGMTAVCFTEHVDPNPRDTGYGFYDYDAYRAAIEEAREAFDGRLEILMGIEFGEPHLYRAEFEIEQARPYDLIMGSLHFSGPWFFGEKELLEQHTMDDVFKRYYEDLCAMALNGGFDVMAHIGFPQRYMGAFPMPESEAKSVSQTLVQTGIVPEINTSGFRKGFFETLPDRDFLQAYRRMGGRLVTAGSDAHSTDEIGCDFDQADRMMSDLALTPVIFRGRAAVPLQEPMERATDE